VSHSNTPITKKANKAEAEKTLQKPMFLSIFILPAFYKQLSQKKKGVFPSIVQINRTEESAVVFPQIRFPRVR